ncbi:13424_t:CDS:1, partial [Cetraspora pellucida]
MTWNTSALQLKHKHPIHKPTCTKTTKIPTPTQIACCQPGSSGFISSGTVYPLGLSGSVQDSSTPQQCCERCYNTSNCTEWIFSSSNVCLISTNPDTCNSTGHLDIGMGSFFIN